MCSARYPRNFEEAVRRSCAESKHGSVVATYSTESEYGDFDWLLVHLLL